MRQHWSGWEVEDNGSRIRCNVGTTLARINEVLKPYARRMGPDPASINAATIGGVLANNAGGMRCRPAIDSYHSIVGMKIVLTTGTIIDTEDPHAEEQFCRIRAGNGGGTIEDPSRSFLRTRSSLPGLFGSMASVTPADMPCMRFSTVKLL